MTWYRVKRAKEKKTKRAKTIKQLTGMGRRHLLGVRVVMKNMVYVVGMTLPAPGDDVSTRKSNEATDGAKGYTYTSIE
jgi:CCR4-NOT transcription complex subunit 4